MKLYLLRHGIAADLGTGGVVRDEDRPLTDEGRAKMRQEARGMRNLELSLDLILTSPLLRARQTAEVVAEVLELESKLILADALAPGCGFVSGVGKHAEIYQELSAHQFESALLVGHMPDLAELASALLSGNRQLAIEFKKGALCAIEVASIPPHAPGTLCWLLAPRQLRLIGRS